MRMMTEGECKENLSLIVKLIILCAVITAMTGCSPFFGGSGYELGAKVGLYRVDEKSDSSSTTNAQTKPLMCYFKNCTKEEMSHGS